MSDGARCESALHTPQTILRQVLGYRQFRGQQQQIIDHVLTGGHALALMPTGGGKSLCYQIPALIRPGTAVVISPLIALMRDQVSALQHNGVAAAVLNSSLSAQEQRRTEQALRSEERRVGKECKRGRRSRSDNKQK